jgi:hypothetical protein
MVSLYPPKKIQLKSLLFDPPLEVSKTVEGYNYFFEKVVHM